jgi:hypothetical protein
MGPFSSLTRSRKASPARSAAANGAAKPKSAKDGVKIWFMVLLWGHVAFTGLLLLISVILALAPLRLGPTGAWVWVVVAILQMLWYVAIVMTRDIRGRHGIAIPGAWGIVYLFGQILTTIVAFAAIYAADPANISMPSYVNPDDGVWYLYMSLTIATTIGFGDFSPIGLDQVWFVMAEMTIMMFYLIFFFGSAADTVSKVVLDQKKQVDTAIASAGAAHKDRL